jgi:cytochrome P450
MVVELLSQSPVMNAALVAAVLVGIIVAIPLLFVLIQIAAAVYRLTIGEWFNSWKFVPKVKTTDPLSLFFGDFRAIKMSQPGEKHVEWMNELGPVYRYRHMFGVQRVMLADPKALLHVLSPARAYQYPKPEYTSQLIAAIIGDGLVASEGERHARQRKIIAPAFAPGAIKDFAGYIHEQAAILVNKFNWVIETDIKRREGLLKEDVEIPGQTKSDRAYNLDKSKNATIIDTLFWLSRTTLDIIGEVGFNVQFNSIENGSKDTLAAAMANLIGAVLDVDLVQAVMLLLSEKPGLSWLRYLPTKRNITMRDSRMVVRDHASRIVDNFKKEIINELSADSKSVSKDTFDEWTSSDNGRPKSVVARMIRANMATGLKPSERMSNEELMHQLTTLIIAGHETTATQNTWALWLLATNKPVQTRLRQILREAAAKDAAEREELPEEERARWKDVPIRDVASVSYLDHVVKESIRMLPSVPSTVRVALKDDVVPLSRPYKRADGKGTYNSIVLPKGHELFIPLNVIQLSKDLWGEDAGEFKPERWDNLPASVLNAKMPPGHTFAFLSGPRSCIGKQLATMETQIILSHLILNFEFDIVPEWHFTQRQQVVRRAFVEGQQDEGIRMPLIVTSLKN